MNKKQFCLIGLGFLAGAAFILIGKVLTSAETDSPTKQPSGIEYLTQDNLGFKYVRPLLDVEYINQDDSLAQFPYMKKIQFSVMAEIDKYPDVKIGYYYNDLSNAGWMGVNAEESFIPASLLKLPMLISYYKIRESEPDLFEKQITYTGNDFNEFRTTNEDSVIKPNNTYSVRQLLEAMIIHSDNNALELLYGFRTDALSEVFEDLKAPLPDSRNDIAMRDFLSPINMSKFFLVLYNGSYLKKVDSEEALELLTKVQYRDGIKTSLPSDVVVAHKYGERQVNVGNGDSENELHDCGIVYRTDNPYLICIMIRGKALDFKTASEIIEKLSKITYDGVIGSK